MVYKFGCLPDGVTDTPYESPNAWAQETTSGPDRLVIAPRDGQVKLLLALSKEMPAPFLILYVLVVSRDNGQPGRYQSSLPIDREELESFLLEYTAFFEGDGRHNLWIRADDDSMLVYDRHNVIYAYGHLDRFASILDESGMTQATQIRYPDSHSHHYNPEFDSDQIRILRERTWIRSTLHASDENPG